ncbi:MAG: hypothetical protein H7Y38_06235, partial [Armatimonadetes bacterium]|nr:hypothetical protein [Armatimonadota bacterium]
TVIAPRREPVPVAVPVAPAPVAVADPVAEPAPKPGVRWWYYLCLLLAFAPPGVVAVVEQTRPWQSWTSDSVGVYLLAGEITGLLSAMLFLLAVGTRMPWGARLLLLIPIGIGGVCMGGVVAKAAETSTGEVRIVLTLIFGVAPLAFLMLQAITARVLWRLWLGVYIALAAIACGCFAAALTSV